MSINIVIGAQWGDEGKGRITDMLAAKTEMVARYSGGDNAGHTVTVNNEIFKLHLIPSGIVHPKVTCLIGNGAVINPAVLLREIDALAEREVDVSPKRLKISRNAHLITPAHIALDKAHEAERGKGAIGTTQRGIGPAYTDKTARVGLRAELFAEPEALANAIQQHVAAKNRTLTTLFNADPLDADPIAAEFAGYAQRLAPYLVDGSVFLDEALKNGRSILAEGAQGTLLDIDHGTYPFVTSSSPTVGGVITGLGIGPKHIDRIIGVAKAFTSRVGSGPFPCELEGEMAARLRGTGDKPWDEFGTTTGRPRRVGWLDLVMLRHAIRINSLTEIMLTKLDILSGLPTIKVCIAYERNGRRVDHFPTNLDKLAECQPIYETLPGWEEDIMAVRELSELPQTAQNYIAYIGKSLGIPVTYASVGPGREQGVFVN
ncbi:MAG: adenylosuccinate synthase [Anaerolineales bacterium]|nr:adenylosuccinate synthase [Anaerolineales bacterium]MCA9930621.1 adenylosuccinate synthase [Anaerolineales bacterium]